MPVRYAPGTRAERVAHPAVQQRLDRQAAWQDFLAAHPGTWDVRWDEATRTPVRFYGTGWDVDATALADDLGAREIGWSIITDDVAALLGDADTADLRDGVVDRRAGITTVTFERTWRGLPVEDARVSLRFAHGRFVMGQLEVMPGVDRTLTSSVPGLDEHGAAEAAVSALAWSADKTTQLGAELVVLPLATEASVSYRLAWRVELRATTFPSHRFVWVDARDGALLRWDEQVRFVDGTVRAWVDDRYPEQGQAERAMPWAELESSAGTIDADSTGTFEVPPELAPGQVTWTAGSRWFDIDSSGGGMAEFQAELAADGGPIVAVPSDDLDAIGEERVLAQLGAHVAAHEARERALSIDPGFPWAQYHAGVHVNLNDGTCNAWFDGDINFLRSGGGCNNTARVHDVVAHEYGHGFHAYSIVDGAGTFDGALSEGLGDYMAATLTGDPGTARGFFSGSHQPLRDIEPNRVWPDDIAGDTHITGLIIAGALWDVRKAMVELYGEEIGVPLADAIFGAAAARAEDIPGAYEEALLANDDDGNLGNGTPDQCLIDDAFGLHGLGPAAPDAPLFAVNIEPMEASYPAGQELPIALTAELSRPACSDSKIGDVVLRWTHSADGALDDFGSTTLAPSASGLYEGSIPAAEAGTLVRWYVEVMDSAGERAGLQPIGSFTDPWFGTWVGGPGWTDVFFTDFEDDDGLFTHRLVEGPDQEGADDWQWGTPAGAGGDPDHAYSGGNAWGNDLASLDNWNGLYQPGVHNALQSPTIEIPAEATRVELQFRRWLTVEDGFWDQGFVTVNGEAVWEQHAGSSQDSASDHHVDAHWALRSYDVTDLVGADGTIEVEWELVTDGGLQLGGWNIDDVRVVALLPTADVIPGDGLEGEGCACSGAARPGAPAALLLLLLVPAIRRRRG